MTAIEKVLLFFQVVSLLLECLFGMIINYIRVKNSGLSFRIIPISVKLFYTFNLLCSAILKLFCK